MCVVGAMLVAGAHAGGSAFDTRRGTTLVAGAHARGSEINSQRGNHASRARSKARRRMQDVGARAEDLLIVHTTDTRTGAQWMVRGQNLCQFLMLVQGTHSPFPRKSSHQSCIFAVLWEPLL